MKMRTKAAKRQTRRSLSSWVWLVLVLICWVLEKLQLESYIFIRYICANEMKEDVRLMLRHEGKGKL